MIHRLLWRLVYWCRGEPTDLPGYILFLERTRKRKPFKPCLRHNQDGRQWEVYFENEMSYCERRTLTLEVYVGQKSGRVTGLIVWDEQLEPKVTKYEMPPNPKEEPSQWM